MNALSHFILKQGVSRATNWCVVKVTAIVTNDHEGKRVHQRKGVSDRSVFRNYLLPQLRPSEDKHEAKPYIHQYIT